MLKGDLHLKSHLFGSLQVLGFEAKWSSPHFPFRKVKRKIVNYGAKKWALRLRGLKLEKYFVHPWI